ncbi:MAG: LacI family DNA-binding transcriptional regulator [Paenibacillaceae bacterium]|nr:LacI family DNA-binding transcriptional regulator [Paenibacillaceae bacterium]
MKRKPTVIDVARRAGVSQPTVSRVLNNHPHIRESTRAKVLQAIQELQFTPDAVARSLVRSKSSTLGLIVGDLSNPFYAETAKCIIRSAHESDYEVIMLDTDYDDALFARCLRTLAAKRVDGIIVASVTRTDERVKELAAKGMPVVLYNRNLDDGSLPSVEADNYMGAYMAMRHLAALGHRKAAFIAGPFQFTTFYHRYRGFRAGMRDFGFDSHARLVYKGAYTYAEVLAFTRRLLERKDRPTAVFATTDQMAIAVLDAASRAGLRIPEDLSVIGYDNIDWADNPYIGLTTISAQKTAMAQLALQQLLRVIEAKDEAGDEKKNMVLEPQLIVRKTTGPCPDSVQPGIPEPKIP